MTLCIFVLSTASAFPPFSFSQFLFTPSPAHGKNAAHRKHVSRYLLESVFDSEHLCHRHCFSPNLFFDNICKEKCLSLKIASPPKRSCCFFVFPPLNGEHVSCRPSVSFSSRNTVFRNTSPGETFPNGTLLLCHPGYFLFLIGAKKFRHKSAKTHASNTNLLHQFVHTIYKFRNRSLTRPCVFPLDTHWGIFLCQWILVSPLLIVFCHYQ